MGNVNMEAYQVHYDGNTVAEKLKELDETVQENEQEIDSLSDIVSIKADKIDIAPIFSEEDAYSAGDLVYHSGRLWKFSVDHAAGEWDSSEVSAVNIGIELSELKNTLKDLEIEEIWENPYPNIAFAGTTIQKNLSKYRFVVIEWNDHDTSGLLWIRVGGARCKACMMSWTSQYMLICITRDVTAETTGVTFADCKRVANGSLQTSNTLHVPKRIYGVV